MNREPMKHGVHPAPQDVASLFSPVETSDKGTELIDVIASGRNIRIERIVSHGHCSDEGFWYDEPQAEWVAVLSGEARIRFMAGNKVVHLRKGDHITISPHERHRVEWTTPDKPTVWLAVTFTHDQRNRMKRQESLESRFRQQEFPNDYDFVDGVAMHAENGDSFDPPDVIKDTSRATSL